MTLTEVCALVGIRATNCIEVRVRPHAVTAVYRLTERETSQWWRAANPDVIPTRTAHWLLP